jgi:hypothetical protein
VLALLLFLVGAADIKTGLKPVYEAGKLGVSKSEPNKTNPYVDSGGKGPAMQPPESLSNQLVLPQACLESGRVTAEMLKLCYPFRPPLSESFTSLLPLFVSSKPLLK